MISLTKKTTLAALVSMVAVALSASPAFATEEIVDFTSTLSSTDAGDHPDIVTSFTLGKAGNGEAARNVAFNTPEGIFGNPKAIDRCTASDFTQTQCPSSSQAGLITVWDNPTNDLLGTAPLYDLVPGPDQTALLGFIVPTLNIPIQVPVTVRTATDYGLRFTVSNITQLTPLSQAEITIWGFPGDPSNDDLRFPKGSAGHPAGCPGVLTADVTGPSCLNGAETTAAIPVHPFTDNPSVCTGEPLSLFLDVQTYQDPDHIVRRDAIYPPITHCERTTFKPVLGATPTTTETDSAAGLDLTLSAPQPLGRAVTPSPIHDSIVTLPDGLTINPDAADGQTACTDAQANFASEGPAACPDSAKIGTIGIHSTALDGTLKGSIYIGQPKPGDQYRLFMVVSGFGLNAKFIGAFRPNPATGQVTAYFQDLPQVPFDEFDVHLFASDRGLVATPNRCGIYTTEARFLPWNTILPDVKSTQIFGLDSGPNGTPCPGLRRPFNPRLAAGTSRSAAGSNTDFSMLLDRDDGDQYLGDLGFTMPPGLTGNLRGVGYCPEADISAASKKSGLAEVAIQSCPASSLVGTTNVAAGPGGHPFHVAGRMYLSGPFKGAPLSLVAITPALAGPYDYGTQVVRVAINVDPLDAHVTALSDTVPSIIGGVPIRMRSIRVNIDRANFMINPTNCSPFEVKSKGIGDQGTVAEFSSYYHADNCSTLGFKPTMRIRLAGKSKAVRRAKNPELQFDLKTRPGDANIKSIAVTLPNAFEIDQRHLGNICSEKELTQNQCAGRTPIGEASTTTPLLDQPLSGPAFAVSGSGGLPRLAFILNGQVDLVPRADTETVRGRLQTTVPVVPDAPIGHFNLMVFGGKTGYLVNTRSLCQNSPIIRIDYVAQNGKKLTQRSPVKTGCKRAAKRHARHRRHAH